MQGSQWNQFKIKAIGDKITLHINNVNFSYLPNVNRPYLPEVKVYASDSFHGAANAKIRSLIFTPISEKPSAIP